MERIKRLFRELENEISSEKFIKLYQGIREKYPPIRAYFSPKDLINCLQNQNNPDYTLNDKILTNLIYEYQTHSNPQLIGSYLLVLFRPGLLKVFFQFKNRIKQFPSLSDLDLWLQIVTLFFEVLAQFDTKKDKSKIASKILGRIKDHLRYYFGKLFNQLKAEDNLEAESIALPLVPPKIEVGEVDILLGDLVNLGIISETDKHILLATSVYGKSMKELSEELKGISYEDIRQKKTRAEKAIRRYIHKKNRPRGKIKHWVIL